MATRRQRSANRRNAQKSTGPRTRIGKQIVRLNSVTHGLTGQLADVAAEDHALHEDFCARIIAEMAPATSSEKHLAQLIAHDMWRLHRAQALDTNMFAAGALNAELDADFDSDEDPALQLAIATTNAFIENARQFATLTIYEQRINRALGKNREEFRELQTNRIRATQLTRYARAA